MSQHTGTIAHKSDKRPRKRQQNKHRQKQRQNKRQQQELYIEGIHAVQEALDAHVPLLQAFVLQGLCDDDLLETYGIQKDKRKKSQRNSSRKDSNSLGSTSENIKKSQLAPIIKKLRELDIPIRFVNKNELDVMSTRGAHQGIVAQVAPYEYASLEKIIMDSNRENALIFLLDHITDEGNLGAIIRSAEVLGATGVIIPNARSARIGMGAYKTSAGAVFRLSVAQVPNIVHALEELQNAGFWSCAATEHAQEVLWQAPLKGKLCVILGSEDKGVSSLVLKRSDFSAKIPQAGTIESLNVAQAASIFGYEWLRQCQCQ